MAKLDGVIFKWNGTSEGVTAQYDEEGKFYTLTVPKMESGKNNKLEVAKSGYTSYTNSDIVWNDEVVENTQEVANKVEFSFDTNKITGLSKDVEYRVLNHTENSETSDIEFIKVDSEKEVTLNTDQLNKLKFAGSKIEVKYKDAKKVIIMQENENQFEGSLEAKGGKLELQAGMEYYVGEGRPVWIKVTENKTVQLQKSDKAVVRYSATGTQVASTEVNVIVTEESNVF